MEMKQWGGMLDLSNLCFALKDVGAFSNENMWPIQAQIHPLDLLQGPQVVNEARWQLMQ